MEVKPSVWQMIVKNLEIITEIFFDGSTNNSIAIRRIVALILRTYNFHEMGLIFTEPIVICSAHSLVAFVCVCVFLRFAGLLFSIDLIGRSAQTNHSILIQDAIWLNRSSAHRRQLNWIPPDSEHFLCYSSIRAETSWERENKRERKRDRIQSIALPDPETKLSANASSRRCLRSHRLFHPVHIQIPFTYSLRLNHIFTKANAKSRA